MNLKENNKVKCISIAKKTALSLFLALLSLSSYAQDGQLINGSKSKGTILISGGVLAHYTSHNVENGIKVIEVLESNEILKKKKGGDGKSTNFTTNFTPKVGYFIMDNLVVGAELGLQTNHTKSSSSSSTTFSVGPFARYYLDNGFFAEGLVGVGLRKTDGHKSTALGLRGGVGYAIPLGTHVSLEPTLNYYWENNKPKEALSNYKETLSSIFLGVGFTVFL